ncbi:MAG TPA: nickel-dependent hydrogenase large subunit, partial [Steroidobacteraceae bacterium]|nr:nickel-dependent hydrogenase large subunit [Steroidobacteraceae bacterium]
AELREFRAYTNGKTNNHTMHSHWARLIELLHCAEAIRDLLHDPDILGTDQRPPMNRRPEGVGVIEAPRGTLIHHYRVDEHDQVARATLIVSTTHNNEAMNRAIREVARRYLDGRQLTEGLLNHIEVAVRAFDPCLSCATHAIGKMPLAVELVDAAGDVVDTLRRG